MTHIYNIKSQVSGEEIRTIASGTRKREIESMFNRIMRSFAKDPKFFVQNIRIGYSKVTYTCILGSVETEYWISRS